MSYLTERQRYKMEGMLEEKATKREIASALGVSLQTVYNELKRGLCEYETHGFIKKSYRADRAHNDFTYKQTAKGREIKLSNNWPFVEFIENEIMSGCSPAVALKRWENNHGFFVSLPTLYRYIDHGYFPNLTNSHLPEKSKRKRKYSHIVKRFPKGTIIEERPKLINKRQEIGHWELDLVVGTSHSSACLMVLTDRVSRYEVILKLKDRKSETICNALDKLYPKYSFKTLTCDNGSEFQNWKRMETTKAGKQRLKVYYCHPYCSSERGSNERMNRMIRRFFPKGTDFRKVTHKEVQAVQDRLNTYERKVLNWHTPQEVYSSLGRSA